jgi:hypothetical protein
MELAMADRRYDVFSTVKGKLPLTARRGAVIDELARARLASSLSLAKPEAFH